jgi:hypothetical protein
LHLAWRTRRPDHDHRLQRLKVSDRLVDALLDRRGLAPAARAVGGNECLGLDTDIRSCTADGAKPPNTTLCGAPIRAQASMATTTSGIIGR